MNKFGYYLANGTKTYSKFVALQIGKTSFHFNDEVFGAIDTTVEPAQTLEQLYIKRAQQIRSKYDYVVLMYSGGSDSNNVLDSFIKADAKIDEICTVWDYPTTGLEDSFHNAEIVKVVLPRLLELTHIEQRLIDLTPFTMGVFDRLGNSFEYYVNYHMSPNNIAKQFLREHVKEWADMIAAGKRLVLVWGCEKPIFEFENDKWYFKFDDRLDNCVGPYTNKPGWYDELFYWTPDMPEIVIKQGHVVRRYCNCISNLHWMWQDTPTDCGYNKYIDKYLTYNALKQIIYPSWDSTTFCNGKSWSMIYSQRDEFFLNGNVHSDRYKQIVDSLYRQAGDVTPVTKRYALWPMHSRRYEL